jgi:integrase
MTDIMDILNNLAETRKWATSTTLTALGELRGALQRATLMGFPHLQHYHGHILLRDAATELQLQQTQEYSQTNRTRPVRLHQLQRALTALSSCLDATMALTLTWTFVGRLGDVLQLQKQHIEMSNDTVKARFVTGKTVQLTRRPYTVMSCLGPWHQTVLAWITSRDDVLFPRPIRQKLRKRIMKELKNFDSKFTVHSIRKGAAIHLAEHGASLRKIRRFTQHATDAMCLRYLDWGWFDVNTQKKTKTTARNLWCPNKNQKL